MLSILKFNTNGLSKPNSCPNDSHHNPFTFAAKFPSNPPITNPLNININNTIVPNGLAQDLNAECKEYDKKIEELGGIDVQLLGVGNNGLIRLLYYIFILFFFQANCRFFLFFMLKFKLPKFVPLNIINLVV